MDDLVRLFPDLPYFPRPPLLGRVREVQHRAAISHERSRHAVAERQRAAEQFRARALVRHLARRTLLKRRVRQPIKTEARPKR